MYDGEKITASVSPALFRVLGYDIYRSVDLFDTRADWQIDLNDPAVIPEKFDLVTNGGTGEHIFNIAAMFKFVHDVLRPGGIALHSMPALGEFDHGFWNVHPSLYFDLAAANDYIIEDMVYVDNIDVRCQQHTMQVGVDFDFGQLLTLEDLRDKNTRWTQVRNRFDAARVGTTWSEYPGAGFPKDYMMVALRKPADTVFRFPFQAGQIGNQATATTDHSNTQDPPNSQDQSDTQPSTPATQSGFDSNILTASLSSVRRLVGKLLPSSVKRLVRKLLPKG